MHERLRAAIRRREVGLTLAMVNRPDLLARCYGGTDKLAHGYFPYYATHLGPLRRNRNVILEIGIGAPAAAYHTAAPGGSLLVWRDYFYRSLIAGLDITSKSLDYGPRVRVYQGDQSLADDLNRVADDLGTLDVVIDDGSHVGRHQIASFGVLFPRLTPGGWYVIEDLSTSYYESYEGAIPAPQVSGVGLTQTLVDAVQTQDPTFRRWPEWGPRPETDYPGVAAIHSYPGVTFIRKVNAVV